MNHQMTFGILNSRFCFLSKLGLWLKCSLVIVALQGCADNSSEAVEQPTTEPSSSNVAPGYQLQNKLSTIRFISIKNSAIAESHRFSEFEGSIDESGQASISIALDSVETLISIRNERMREFLFDTANFQMATITATIDPIRLAELAVGEQWLVDLQLSLDLHGKSKSYTQAVEVIRLANGTVQVHSLQPVIVRAADFDLLKGIEKLAELANLPSIAKAIPVEVLLVFSAD